MEEKKQVNIRLSTAVLIVIIVALIGGIVFLTYQNTVLKSKQDESKTELQELQNKMTQELQDSQNKIQELQKTIDETKKVVTNTTNSNNSNSSSSESKNTINNKQSSSTNSNSSTKDTVESKILGKWRADKVTDDKGNDLGLSSVWGTGIQYSNEMIFKENGVFVYNIGITPSSENGEYDVVGDIINYGIPTDSNKLNWNTFTYIPEEDILREENEEKQIITYVRVK